MSAPGAPESNVERARRGFEAAAGGDLEAIRELLDPGVEWHGSAGPGADSCHNREEALHFMGQALRRGRLGELVDVIDAGEHVVVVMRPPGEGAELRANVTTFRDGRAVRIVAYESPEQALAAARA